MGIYCAGFLWLLRGYLSLLLPFIERGRKVGIYFSGFFNLFKFDFFKTFLFALFRKLYIFNFFLFRNLGLFLLWFLNDGDFIINDFLLHWLIFLIILNIFAFFVFILYNFLILMLIKLFFLLILLFLRL